MPDLLYIPVKLKEQGKVRRLHIGALHQHAVVIQRFLQHICPETLRHHGQFQIPFIAHVIGDRIIGISIRIKIGRLAVWL